MALIKRNTILNPGQRNGGLQAGEVYRVLLMGYSWGADKAMQVAVKLRAAIDGDPDLRRLNLTDRVQIHLRTFDAIDIESGEKWLPQGPVDEVTKKEVAKSVASWYNFFQQGTNVQGRQLALPFSRVIAAELSLDAAGEGVQVGNRAMGDAAEPVHFQA